MGLSFVSSLKSKFCRYLLESPCLTQALLTGTNIGHREVWKKFPKLSFLPLIILVQEIRHRKATLFVSDERPLSPEPVTTPTKGKKKKKKGEGETEEEALSPTEDLPSPKPRAKKKKKKPEGEGKEVGSYLNCMGLCWQLMG